ncbi:uridylate kinase [Picrophilus oshimae DSM 9789]|uniref:Uridylate kinase n=2 Tax=Picrophilus oshimae TaxID=46632 RepID=A0A8G2L815_PICTO|nr:uridylate kinase [Picrophilus oshimae DSM 9789]
MENFIIIFNLNPRMKRVVISLGGSIISMEKLNLEFMEEFSRMLGNIKGYDGFGIVVGGGKLARTYISDLRKYNVNDNILDEIGINATRINALAMTTFLDDVNSKIPTTVNDAAEMMHDYRYVVMGGTEPGHTTDTVAMLFAERINADVMINGTSVDGVYTEDPRKNRNAKKIDRMNYDDAIKLSIDSSIGAGSNVFMDITSLSIAKRSGIKIFVINGLKIDEYINILYNGTCNGTIIE